jgi:transposase
MRNNWVKLTVETPAQLEIMERTTTENIKPIAKSKTTAHFVKFLNKLLNVMGKDENLIGSYLVMDNCTIHKSHSMIRKIESRDYRVIHLPPYSPERNPIEQF